MSKKISGNSMIEFALTLPILMLILVGIIEFGAITYNKAVITNASREGARYGIVFRTPSYASTSEIATYTENYCQGKLITFGSTPANVTVTVTQSSVTPTFGDTLTVTVDFIYTDLVLHNFLNLGQSHQLQSSTTMTYE